MKVGETAKKLFSGLKKVLQKVGTYIQSGLHKVLAFFKKLIQRMKTMKLKYVILVVLILLILAGGVYAGITFWQITELERVFLDNNFATDVIYNVDEEFSQKFVNIAVLGFDRNAEREKYAQLFLPDFIAVVSINFETGDVKFVRVLRDTYVPMSVTGAKDKINHSYYYGYTFGTGPDRHQNGLQCTLDTVSAVMGGVPIHYYVSVNMDGLAYIVDAIGGVEYKVKENLYDKTGKRVLKKGLHHFDGESFVLFVRHRDDNSGQDVGRALRQFDILHDLFESLRDRGMLRNIPSLFKVYRDYIETNLSMKQVAALAYYAMDFNPPDDMYYCFQGTSQTKDGIWYWVLDQAYRVQVIKEVFGITAELWPQEVLTDTPPPAVASFEYDLDTDSKGNPVVELSWVPGDDKKVRYELYRDGELLLETDADNPITEYRDTDVDEGDTYEYTLRVFHYRAEGPSASLKVRITPPSIEIPNVTGMSLDDAEDAIEDAGFVFGGEGGAREYSDTVPAGKVIKTIPAVGTKVEKGSTVHVILSKGPEPELVKVPDVTGKSIEQARDIIEGADLDFAGEGGDREHHDEIPEGCVIRTIPPAGNEVEKGSPVKVIISKGKEESQEPPPNDIMAETVMAVSM